MKKLLFVILFLFFLSNYVFAYTTSNISGMWGDIFSGLQKIIETIYLFFWPLLFIASKLLSNNWVFGGSFHLDTIFWQLWQIMRVFANYFLGFVFLISIFIYFFKAESNLSWKKIFPKVVIAAVLVNMSWFLLGVMVDISSLLIGAFGSMASSFKNYVSKVGTDKDSKLTYLPVVFDGDKFYVDYNGSKYVPCIYKINKNLQTITKPANTPCFTFEGGKYVLFNSPDNSITVKGFEVDPPKESILFSFYRYLYNDFFVNTVQTKGALFIVFASKIFIFAVLLIPLVVLVIILAIRLVILWVVIPFSPLFLAAYILGLVPGEYKNKLTEIVSLIFQPAYVMFMLGIGFIIIEAVYQMEPKKHIYNKSELEKVFNYKIEDEGKKITLGNYVVIEGTNNTNGDTSSNITIKQVANYFSWFVTNLLAGFILWALVFTALKSNKFTEKVASSIDTYAKKSLETLPILPGKQSIASLEKAWGTISTRLPEQRLSTQSVKLQNAFKPKKDEDNNENT